MLFFYIIISTIRSKSGKKFIMYCYYYWVMKLALIQPRHNYAPSEGLGHVYMPTSLLTVGARLLSAGVEVEFHDENIRPKDVSANYVGFNLLGAPYIPEVIKRGIN